MENPPPNPAPWSEIDDPSGRTERAILDMYNYFDTGKDMLDKVLRDASQVAAMDEIRRQKWVPMLESMIDIIAEAWDSGTTARLRASLRVVLDFFTWQILSDSGLSNTEAAKLAAAWIEASAVAE
jgi:hypothetical protein